MRTSIGAVKAPLPRRESKPALMARTLTAPYRFAANAMAAWQAATAVRGVPGTVSKRGSANQKLLLPNGLRPAGRAIEGRVAPGETKPNFAGPPAGSIDPPESPGLPSPPRSEPPALPPPLAVPDPAEPPLDEPFPEPVEPPPVLLVVPPAPAAAPVDPPPVPAEAAAPAPAVVLPPELAPTDPR